MFLLLTVLRPALGLERIWKEAVVARFDVDLIIQEMSWGAEKNHDIPAEIRAECIY
jgi:hypothetical protein